MSVSNKVNPGAGVILGKQGLGRWLGAMAADYQVFGPAKRGNVLLFDAGSDPAAAAEAVEIVTAPGYQNTVTSPKKALFPQTETIFRFNTVEGNLAIEPVPEQAKDRLLFGVRPCDARAFELLDRVMDAEFQDSLYLSKRGRAAVIAVGCEKMGETCFCTSLGLDPTDAPGADVVINALGPDRFLVSPRTPRGEDLVKRLGADAAQAGEADLEAMKEKKGRVANTGTLKPDLEGVPEKLRQMFKHPYWDEIAEKCLGCGICTYLCPTCHCFDISDWSRGGEGERFRCWDSCMYRDFTLMAGGHNPRPSKTERVRQRFLHKLRYFPERYGVLGCVGCGRCVEKCPVHMDITEIISDVKGVELEHV